MSRTHKDQPYRVQARKANAALHDDTHARCCEHNPLPNVRYVMIRREVGTRQEWRTFMKMKTPNGATFSAEVIPAPAPPGRYRARCRPTGDQDELKYDRDQYPDAYPCMVDDVPVTYPREVTIPDYETHIEAHIIPDVPCDIVTRNGRCWRRTYHTGSRADRLTPELRRLAANKPERAAVRVALRDALVDWNTNGDTDISPDYLKTNLASFW